MTVHRSYDDTSGSIVYARVLLHEGFVLEMLHEGAIRHARACVFGLLAASLALPPRPSFVPSLAVVNLPMSLFANVEVASLVFAYPASSQRVHSSAHKPNLNE